MLRGFSTSLAEHLGTGGEGWLIISDLAEHLGLRSRDELLQWIDHAGLEVKEKLDTDLRHPRSMDRSDTFFDARSQEIVSPWRLVARA